MIKREAEAKIKELQSKYLVLLVMGPRQSGKTTLVRKLFPDYVYRNLEAPDVRLMAMEDPRSFLALGSGQKMILDEIQEVPELVSYIQTEVDERQIKAQYVLTGSQNLQISAAVTQSLAGRVGQIELLPLTYEELKTKYPVGLDEYLLAGSYPRLYVEQIKPSDFFRDYVNTYVTRDVRTLRNIGNLSDFQRMMQLLAGRVGQILNMSALASEVGVETKTIKSWLSVLEASYIVFRLQPYYENFGKRVVKSPKLYFYDTGLVTYLLGIRGVAELRQHFAYGSLFENLVIAEKLKRIENRRLQERLYFWRDKHGTEVDLVVDRGLEKVLVEIKASRTFKPEMMVSLDKVAKVMGERYRVRRELVYQGEMGQEVKGVRIRVL